MNIFNLNIGCILMHICFIHVHTFTHFHTLFHSFQYFYPCYLLLKLAKFCTLLHAVAYFCIYMHLLAYFWKHDFSNVCVFSPNWPTGPIWSSSRDVRPFVYMWHQCPLPMQFSQGSKGGPRGAKPSPTVASVPWKMLRLTIGPQSTWSGRLSHRGISTLKKCYA